AFGGMQPQLQRVERELAIHRYRQLAIDDEAFRRQTLQHLDDIRKVACQGLAGFGPELDLLARAEGKAAEAVPFGLEAPAGVPGDFVDELRFHGRKVEGYWQIGEAHALANSRLPLSVPNDMPLAA